MRIMYHQVLRMNYMINSSVDLNNTFSLTFDANLYSFSKENSVLYKKEIYDELLK